MDSAAGSRSVAPPDPDRAPILVVGTGRSGTTLLRLLLNAHPRIYLTHEASFYLIRSGLPERPSPDQWLGRYFRSGSFAFLRLGRAEVRAELQRGPGSDRLAGAYRAVMRAKARQYAKPRYGDKTPVNTACLKKIFEDFGDPRVIHVVRDPRGTVASLLRMPWAASSVGLNSLFCQMRLKEVRPFAQRIHEIRLEDLLADTERVMRGVLEFVGEPWDDAVLDHVHHAPLHDVPPFPWFRAAKSAVRPPTGEPAWMRQLDPAWIRNIEQVHRSSMERYGYRTAELDPEPGFAARQLARLADLPEVWHSLRHRKKLLRLTRGSTVPDPREAMVTLMQFNPRAWALYPDFVMPRVPEVR